MKDIIITNLNKSFGDNQVLGNFSARFPAGEITCIMGESGCGKTTLLNILMGLMKADGGKLINVPASIAPVFQEDRLCEDFSAASNIRLAASAPLSGEIILSHMEQTGLTDGGNKPVRELSGGMRRRVAILRAILSGRELLILDEPFKGLDEGTRKLTAGYVKRAAMGRTVIMVTHDPEEVTLMGGHLLTMEKLHNGLNGKDEIHEQE